MFYGSTTRNTFMVSLNDCLKHSQRGSHVLRSFKTCFGIRTKNSRINFISIHIEQTEPLPQDYICTFKVP